MRIRWSSLSARFMFLSLLLAITPLILTGIVAYTSGNETILSSVKAHMESVAILKQQQLDNWSHHLEHTFTWLESDPQIKSNISALIDRVPTLPEYLFAYESLLAEFSIIEELGHVSPIFLVRIDDGQIVASTDSRLEGQFRNAESWFSQTMSGTYISGLSHNLNLEHIIIVASPINDSDGQPVAIVAANANMEDVYEIMLERSGLGESGETYLVDRTNLLLNESRFGAEDGSYSVAFTEGVRRALEGESGVDFYLDYRGEPVVGAYRWLEDMEVALLAEIDQAEVLRPNNALTNRMITISVIVVLAVAVLGVLVARTITKPVRQLVVSAEEIGRGNLDYRIEVGSQDEIGQLSRGFNEMAHNLKAITASRDELNRVLRRYPCRGSVTVDLSTSTRPGKESLATRAKRPSVKRLLI